MRTQTNRPGSKSLLVAAALVIAVVAVPQALADPPIWSVQGPQVFVTVVNPAPVSIGGTVTVGAVVAGQAASGTAPFQCPPASSVVVAVSFAAPVQAVTSVAVSDGRTAF